MLQEEAETLRARQQDIEHETEMVAHMLAQAEKNSDLSATKLVEEALAKRAGTEGSLTATALVRDALAHHISTKDLSSAGKSRRSPSVDETASCGSKALRASIISSATSSHSPAAPRVVSFAYGVDKSEDVGANLQAVGCERPRSSCDARGGQVACQDVYGQSLAVENHALRARLKEMETRVDQVENELQEAVNARADLEAKNKRIELAADRDIDTNLRISINEANRRVSQVQLQLTSATAERDEARRVSQDLKSMMGEVLQRHSADMQQQHEKMHAAQQRVRREADEALRLQVQELDLLRRRTEALQAENAALLMWKEGCEKERERARHSSSPGAGIRRASDSETRELLENLQRSNAQLRVERANLQKERQALLQRNERLALERENAAAQIEVLRERLEELEGKHSAACEQLAVQSQALDDEARQARRGGELAGRLPSEGKGDILRLRECNRLLILELEDTRERLMKERRRQCAVAKGPSQASLPAAARTSGNLAGEMHESARSGSGAFANTGKLLLPMVEVEDADEQGSPDQARRLTWQQGDDDGDQADAQQAFGHDGEGHCLMEEQGRGSCSAHDGERQSLLSSPQAVASMQNEGEQIEPGGWPSPEPQWHDPPGLQPSCAKARVPEAEKGNAVHSIPDASVMNLSHAAVRQLSCTPEPESAVSVAKMSPGDRQDARGREHDASLIGLTGSAVREASRPPEATTPRTLSIHTRPANQREEIVVNSRRKDKGPSTQRRPLAALSRNDINVNRTASQLRGV